MRRRRRKTTTDNEATTSTTAHAFDFTAALTQELRNPAPLHAETMPGNDELDRASDAHQLGALDWLDALDRLDAPEPLDRVERRADRPARADVIDLAGRRAPIDGTDVDFWGRHDEARTAADLLSIPSAAAVAVIGPLEAAVPVVRRCLHQQVAADCEVLVLSEQPVVPDEPDWNVIGNATALVAALEDPLTNTPLILLDAPRDLPPALRPLIARLRSAGIGLVHYVLDVEPDDETLGPSLAHLGRPSVLDLAAPVEPARVLELLERGEPVASVAGVPVTAELLLALRMEVLH